MAIITNSKTGKTFAIMGTAPCGHVVIAACDERGEIFGGEIITRFTSVMALVASFR